MPCLPSRPPGTLEFPIGQSYFQGLNKCFPGSLQRLFCRWLFAGGPEQSLDVWADVFMCMCVRPFTMRNGALGRKRRGLGYWMGFPFIFLPQDLKRQCGPGQFSFCSACHPSKILIKVSSHRYLGKARANPLSSSPFSTLQCLTYSAISSLK